MDVLGSIRGRRECAAGLGSDTAIEDQMKYEFVCLGRMWCSRQRRMMIVSCYVDGTHEGKIGTHGEDVLHHCHEMYSRFDKWKACSRVVTGSTNV